MIFGGCAFGDAVSEQAEAVYDDAVELFVDPCRQLCQQVAARLASCMSDAPGWEGVAWIDFGVSDRAEFREQCESEWEAERAELEPRQVQGAQDQCEDARSELRASDCDDLLALYLGAT